jgi:hypothetical protein
MCPELVEGRDHQPGAECALSWSKGAINCVVFDSINPGLNAP